MEKSGVTSRDIVEEVECLLMKCTLCEGSYSEERVPRSWTCGHSLCTKCTSQYLTTDWYCPECHVLEKLNRVTEFPVNYSLLRLARSIAQNEISLENIVGPLPLVPVAVPSSDKEDPWKCPVHGSPTAFLCISCSTWVCRDCLVLDHPYMPRGSCRILRISKAMEIIRKDYEREAHICVTYVKHIKNNLKPELANLEFSTKHCLSNDECHRRLRCVLDEKLDKLKQEDESTVNIAMDLITKLLESVKKTSLDAVKTLCQELFDCRDGLKEYIAQENTRKMDLQQDLKVHLRMDLTILVQGQKSVYTLLEYGSGSRWGKLTPRTNDRILVHSLKEGRPPEDGIIIPYEFIGPMVQKNYPSVFFEFGTENEAKGFIDVRLFQNCPRVRNVVSLCSGEGGLCYRDTALFKYQDKGYSLGGGDLENNDGTGSDNTIGSADDFCVPDKHCRPLDCLFTAVTGSISKFVFQNRKMAYCNGKNIGKVIYGKDSMKSLLHSESLDGCIVRDCGVFLARITEGI